MTRPASYWVLGAALFSAAAASAHHSAAMFDFKKTQTIKGAVTVYQWTNPHAFLYVKAPDGKGNSVEYHIELTSPNLLARRGWRPSTFKVGDEVSVEFNPLRDGSTGGRVVSVTTASGKVLTERAPQ